MASVFKTKNNVQHTVNKPTSFTGKGVHSNQTVDMTLFPAEADSGIVFVRNAGSAEEIEIPALYSSVAATELCTIIGDPNAAFVATIEHLMAALYALQIDNVRIEISGSEVPVMDGSSSIFIEEIVAVGLMPQLAPRRFLKVEKPVRVDMGSSFAELTPHDGCEFDVEIDFTDPVIGRQRYALYLTAERFAKEISRARTFGFMRDVEKLWAAGYALGSSFENSVVVGEEGIVNPDGLRFKDEFVRHKLLDAVGDLALCGAPLLGRYRSYRGGHKLNLMMVKALFEDREAWSFVEAVPSVVSGSAAGWLNDKPAVAMGPINS